MIKAAIVFAAICVVYSNAATTLQLKNAGYRVVEGQGPLVLHIIREGDVPTKEIEVMYETAPGTAKPDDDYEPIKGSVVVFPNEAEKLVHVRIVDDNKEENDEFFDFKVTGVNCGGDANIKLGDKKVSKVRIIDDDLPGAAAAAPK